MKSVYFHREEAPLIGAIIIVVVIAVNTAVVAATNICIYY